MTVVDGPNLLKLLSSIDPLLSCARATFFKAAALRNALLIAVALATSAAALAQVCATPGKDSATTSIAGVVNSYYPGTAASVAAGSQTVAIGGLAAGGNTTPIAAGDLLVIMQMQGAQINSSNSDCYGDGVGTAGCITRSTTTSSYAGGNLASTYLAGNWEYCTATTAAGTSVGVACAGAGGGTVNAYRNAASTGASSDGNYSYQVVRVPQYTNTALTGNLTPLAWNGSAGGVLALQANGTVNLAGFNLNVSASGFRGGGVNFTAPYGPPVIDPVNGSSFYVAPTGALPGGEREGSFKGEGIAGTPQLVYNGTVQTNTGVDGYTGGSRSRGAPANAGGGGNNQNSGGGGGGNGGQGGQGGGGWNDVSRPVTFRDSGGFGGDGASRSGNNLNLSATRLIMGGGGGGGHVDGGGTNCDLGAWGGNGAGVMIIRAATLSGAGSLLASGGNGFAPNTAGACTDAAGGAGAGGTVLAAVNTGLSGRTVNVSGGAGATSSYSQHGPGGGGGGGVVYYNSGAGTPSITANGGPNGLDTPTITATSAWFATTGTVSALTTSITSFNTACSTVLDVTKTDAVTAVQAGGTTTYTVTFVNSGATAADGAVAKDLTSPGLSCTVFSCAPSLLPIPASCPAAASWPSLLTPAGLALPVLPSKSSVTFVVKCNVTATGQ